MIRSAEKNGERTDTMEKSDIRYQAYVKILEEELKPAMGCTEPIAIAYCAAVAREVLGGLPEKVKVGASGSMIKNVKSVIVPNTDHLKGIPAAAAAGIVAGDPKKELEVIASVTKEQITAMKEFLQTTPVEVEHIDNGITFDIIVTLTRGTDTSMVRIANYHTNVVHIEKNGEVIRDIPVNGEEEEGLTDRSLLDMEHIWDFIHTVDVNDIREVLERQKTYNMAIAREGMRGQYGSNIGALLLDMNGNDDNAIDGFGNHKKKIKKKNSSDLGNEIEFILDMTEKEKNMLIRRIKDDKEKYLKNGYFNDKNKAMSSNSSEINLMSEPSKVFEKSARHVLMNNRSMSTEKLLKKKSMKIETPKNFFSQKSNRESKSFLTSINLLRK